jgi:hypothetical protein
MTKKKGAVKAETKKVEPKADPKVNAEVKEEVKVPQEVPKVEFKDVDEKCDFLEKEWDKGLKGAFDPAAEACQECCKDFAESAEACTTPH